MKKLLFFLGMITMGAWIINAQNKVIYYPVSGVRTTESLEIYRAEVSDTAVILYGNLYNRPNYWVKIASSSILKGKNTNKNYRLIRTTGIQTDRKEYMPDTYTRSFSMQFEPVDPKDEYVDFYETPDNNTGFTVNDIRLSTKTKSSKIHCRIEGTVINHPAYSRIMLMRYNSDPRVNEWISIPVIDGKFSYDLYTDLNEPYELYPWSAHLNGAWSPVSFFAEEGMIRITIRPLKEISEIHTETPLNKELLRFRQEIKERFTNSIRQEREQLEKADKVMTPEMKILYRQMETLYKTEQADKENKLKELDKQIQTLKEKGKVYTEEYQAFEKKTQKMYREMKDFQNEYIRRNVTLPGLFLLMSQVAIDLEPEGINTIKEIYNALYDGKFTDNPMSNYMKHWIISQQIQVGSRFIDFTIPDAEGKLHTLSEEIKGKVALIDLWASWCGPCRRLSISMIPIYEAYKDKGFTVVGVARERKLSDMTNCINRDKYPWLNLLELNDSNKIWEEYGIGNGGGRTFLVDREGCIIAIHPDAEQVKMWLEKLL